jgi:hypothetical protein
MGMKTSLDRFLVGALFVVSAAIAAELAMTFLNLVH